MGLFSPLCLVWEPKYIEKCTAVNEKVSDIGRFGSMTGYDAYNTERNQIAKPADKGGGLP